jgi:hypothetical protein
MSKKLSMSRILAASSLLLSGLVLGGGPVGCDPYCEKNPADPSCRTSPPLEDMGMTTRTCTPACSGAYESCNTASLQCVCDVGYQRQAGVCKPVCEVNPADPSCPKPAGKPDLVVDELKVNIPDDADLDIKLCFPSTSYYVSVKNQGNTSAGSYKVGYGFLDQTSNTFFNCKGTFPSGTAAGATSKYFNTGYCCVFPYSTFTTGHTYVMAAWADIGSEVDESDERNNVRTFGTPIKLFAPDGNVSTSQAESLRSSLRVLTPGPMAAMPTSLVSGQLAEQ